MQFGNVRGIGIEDGPADSGSHRGTGDLRQSGSTYGLKHNGRGTHDLVGLNGAEKLCALRDGVAVRIDDFEFSAEILRGKPRGGSMLKLKVVILRNKRKKDAKVLHSAIFSSWNSLPTLGNIAGRRPRERKSLL